MSKNESVSVSIIPEPLNPYNYVYQLNHSKVRMYSIHTVCSLTHCIDRDRDRRLGDGKYRTIAESTDNPLAEEETLVSEKLSKANISACELQTWIVMVQANNCKQ